MQFFKHISALLLLLSLTFALPAQLVEYGATIGELRSDMALSSQNMFGKGIFLEEGQDAIVIGGNEAFDWLSDNGYAQGQIYGDELARVKELLTLPGAIAVLLPDWAPESPATSGGETILYIPYPSEAEVQYNLQNLAGYYVVPTVGQCTACECYQGLAPNSASCVCAGMSACCPCPGGWGGCDQCNIAFPKPDQATDLCQSFPGCDPGVFHDPRPMAELMPGMQL